MKARSTLAGAFLLAILVALVASCGAAARGPDLNSPAAKTAMARTVHILVVCDDSTGYGGSAVVANAETLVTAKHMLQQAKCPGPMLILDTNGEPMAVAELAEDVDGTDVVVMHTPGWAETQSLVCFRPPVVGEHVLAVGYPDGKFAVTEGVVGEVVGPSQQAFSARVSPGSSGGGVWADDACLVGVVSLYHKNSHTGVMVPVAGDATGD